MIPKSYTEGKAKTEKEGKNKKEFQILFVEIRLVAVDSTFFDKINGIAGFILFFFISFFVDYYVVVCSRKVIYC